MSLREKIIEKKKQMQEQIIKGQIVSEQKKAERLRQKANKLVSMKPGARKAIVEGLAMKKTTMQVMREEYERRKQLREESKDEDT